MRLRHAAAGGERGGGRALQRHAQNFICTTVSQFGVGHHMRDFFASM